MQWTPTLRRYPEGPRLEPGSTRCLARHGHARILRKAWGRADGEKHNLCYRLASPHDFIHEHRTMFADQPNWSNNIVQSK